MFKQMRGIRFECQEDDSDWVNVKRTCVDKLIGDDFRKRGCLKI